MRRRSSLNPEPPASSSEPQASSSGGHPKPPASSSWANLKWSFWSWSVLCLVLSLIALVFFWSSVQRLHKVESSSFPPPPEKVESSSFPPPPEKVESSSFPPPPEKVESSSFPPPPEKVESSSVPPPPEKVESSSVPPPPEKVESSSVPPPPEKVESSSFPPPPEKVESSSVPPRPDNVDASSTHNVDDLSFLEDVDMSFLEDAKFEPYYKRIDKLRRENAMFYRLRSVKLKIGLVFTHLLVDESYQNFMISLASALKNIGHEIQVLTLEDGPVGSVWREDYGICVRIIKGANNVNWLKYDAVFLNSFEAMDMLSCLSQEPFKSVPVIWTVRERALAFRLKEYNSTGLVDSWRKVFRRANAVVFPNYNLPVAYSIFDTGNYFVIPELPTESQENVDFLAMDIYAKMECGPENFIITIVGSQQYKDLLREQALILRALLPVFKKRGAHLKIIVFAGPSVNNYILALETIALKLKYPIGMVKHIGPDEDADSILRLSNIVIYASLHEEEQSFPYTLQKAMWFQRPVVAPDLPFIKKYVVDGVNGFLFSRKDIKQVLPEVSVNQLQNITIQGMLIATHRMISKSIEGYALLLENIIEISPGVAAKSLPVPEFLVQQRIWLRVGPQACRICRTYLFLKKVEKQFNHTQAIPMHVMNNIIMDKFLRELENKRHAKAKDVKDERWEPRTVVRESWPWTAGALALDGWSIQ